MQSIAPRALFCLTIVALAGSAAVQCGGDATTSPANDAATEPPVDLCNVDTYTGVGKPCPYVSSKLCFRQCDSGGCKCVGSPNGPVWSCVTDHACDLDGSPLDDVVTDTSSPIDAGADAIADAPTDG